MADASSDPFGDWYHALGALTAVVKLFADKALKLPDDRALLDRLEQAEKAARFKCHPPIIRRYTGGGSNLGASLPASSPLSSQGALVKPGVAAGLPISQVPPGAAEFAALGPHFDRAAAGLKRPERQRLTRRVEHATTAVVLGRPGATKSLGGLRVLVLEIFAGAGGQELAKGIDHVITIIQAKPR
jgi:hypothetical protein